MSATSSNSSGGADGQKNNEEASTSTTYQPGRRSRCLVPDSKWQKLLNEDQFFVCRLKGTEAPFSGELNDHKETGLYNCSCCGATLFSSEAKFDAGCGWPSFFKPHKIEEEETNLEERKDSSRSMVRTEVVCKLCGSHLGHVFPDGPPPTGLRYCINSVSIRFEKEDP